MKFPFGGGGGGGEGGEEGGEEGGGGAGGEGGGGTSLVTTTDVCVYFLFFSLYATVRTRLYDWIKWYPRKTIEKNNTCNDNEIHLAMKLHLPKEKKTTQYLYCQRNFAAPVPLSVHFGVHLANFRCQYSSVQITWPTENFGRQEAAFVQYYFYYGVCKRDQRHPACLPKFSASQFCIQLYNLKFAKEPALGLSPEQVPYHRNVLTTEFRDMCVWFVYSLHLCSQITLSVHFTVHFGAANFHCQYISVCRNLPFTPNSSHSLMMLHFGAAKIHFQYISVKLNSVVSTGTDNGI